MRLVPTAISMRRVTLIAAVVIFLDQLAKLAATRFLSVAHPAYEDPVPGESWVVIPGFFQFMYRTNTGAAWSMFRDHSVLLMIFASAVALGLAVWSWRLQPGEQILRWPLAIILGGALGNLIDRYRLKYVIDFIAVHWEERHFPTFNIADSAIFIGMCWLIWISFAAAPQPEEQAEPDPGA